MTGHRGCQEQRNSDARPANLALSAPGPAVHVYPLPRCEEAIVCPACGASRILQEGKGGSGGLEGREVNLERGGRVRDEGA